MKKTILVVTTVLTLAACSSQPAQTLDQKLSDATAPADRKETLRLACLNEAEWPVRSTKNPYHGVNSSYKRMEQLQSDPEVRQMKAICRQMDDLTTADADEKLPSTQLASSCAEIVGAKKAKTRKGGTEHAIRIEEICEKMTGEKIGVDNKALTRPK